MGIIPVVNENDSVSYTEIESDERLFGDNDMLSAVVAVLCRAKRLIILGMRTKAAGCFPRHSTGDQYAVITNGKRLQALYDIVNGINAGTLFVGKCIK